MREHRFRVGQTVRFVRGGEIGPFADIPADNFVIVGLLPDRLGDNQYRLESTRDRHHRVVVESEIA